MTASSRRLSTADSPSSAPLLREARSNPLPVSLAQQKVRRISEQPLHRGTGVNEFRRPVKYTRLREENREVKAGAAKVNRLYRNLSHLHPPQNTTYSNDMHIAVIDASAANRGMGDLFPNCPGAVSGEMAQGVGLTTAFCAVDGAYATASALRRREFARSLGDAKGVQLEGLNVVSSGAIGAGGAAYGAYRGLKIATFFKNAVVSPAAPTLLGKAAWTSLALGNVLFGVFYVTGAIKASLAIREAKKMHSELTTPESLARCLQAPTRETFQVTEDDLELLVKEQAGRWLDQMFDQMVEHKIIGKRPTLSEKECRELAWNLLLKNKEQVLQELYNGWPEHTVRSLLKEHKDDPILALGHALKLEAAILKHNTRLNELLGEARVKELRSKPLTAADVEAVKTELKKAMALKTAALGTYIAGITWVIYSFFSDLISTWIYAIQSFVCLALDRKGVKAWLSNVKEGKGDVKMAILSMATALISMALVFFLYTYFGLPGWIFFSAMAMDGIWLGVGGLTLHKIWEHQELHPTLASFKKFLLTSPSDDAARVMYARLSEEDRRALEKETAEERCRWHEKPHEDLTAVELVNIVTSLLKKREEETKEHLNGLKGLLSPYLDLPRPA